MTNIALLQSLGLFDARVPRYTSYPAAPVFSGAVGADFQAQAIEALDPAVPISVYVHVPFCERLCWFCACRTQGTQTLAPVEAYVGTLLQELELVKQHLPAGVKAGRLHWGGGTPTILSPELIHKLAQAIKAVIPFAEDYEFSVEIDPMMVDEPKIRALSEGGHEPRLDRHPGLHRHRAECDRARAALREHQGLRRDAAPLRCPFAEHRPRLRAAAPEPREPCRHHRQGALAEARPRGDLRLCPCAVDGQAPEADRRDRAAPRHRAARAGQSGGAALHRRRVRAHRDRPFRAARRQHGGGCPQQKAAPQLPGLHRRHLPDASGHRRLVDLEVRAGLSAEHGRHRRLYQVDRGRGGCPATGATA